MDENKKLDVEIIKQIGNTSVQCVMIIGVIAITIFACVYFDNPKYLWLLCLLLLVF